MICTAKKASRRRLFFALWPDDATRGRIAECQQPFRTLPARWIRVENLHITLAFLGSIETERVVDIVRAATTVNGRRFDLRLNTVHSFHRSEMLWLSPSQTPQALIQLVDSLKEALQPFGFKPERRQFRPHVTLARKFSHRTAAQNVTAIEWQADRFSLIESQVGSSGSHYYLCQSWPLKPLV